MEVSSLKSNLPGQIIPFESEEWSYYLNLGGLPYIIFNLKEYVALFKADNYPELFVYYEEDDFLVFPYIKSKIENSDFFDIESIYGFGGLTSTTSESNFIESALKKFVDYCKQGNIIAGFFRFNPHLENPLLKANTIVDVIPERNIILLSLQNKTDEEIWSGYNKKNRNKIRKAEKLGVVVRKLDSLEAINVFHNIYTITVERLNTSKFYRFSKDFFHQIYYNLKGKYHLLLAYDTDNKPIAGAILLQDERVMYYYLSATTDIARAVGASNLLRHQAILFSKQQGLELINFGGGLSSSDEDTLYKYKKTFSKEECPFYIGKAIFNHNIYEDLCHKWKEKASKEAVDKYGNYHLKYRF